MASLIQPLSGKPEKSPWSRSPIFSPLSAEVNRHEWWVFQTLLWPFPWSFFFSLLPEKQVHAVFDPSGRKAPLKEGLRGSIWGQKTTKHPHLLWFWCYVTQQCALRKSGPVFRLTVKLNNPFIAASTASLLVCSCFCSHRPPFFSLDIANASPIPPDFPPSLPTTLSRSCSVTLLFILFKGEGRHLFLGYLPISMMAAHLIIRDSSLDFFLLKPGKLASDFQSVDAFV